MSEIDPVFDLLVSTRPTDDFQAEFKPFPPNVVKTDISSRTRHEDELEVLLVLKIPFFTSVICQT